MKCGVFFGTSTGSTETVADMLIEKLGAEGPFDVDDGESIVDSFRQYDALIVGTPTWNTGADVERSGTGWDELYYGKMSGSQLINKKVAVFGLGDSVSYAENFSDAAGELHDVFEKQGCQMGFGYVSQEGYLHEASKSIRADGKFCGLLLDVENQEELTEERVDKWVAQLTAEGFLEGGSDSSSSSAPAGTVAAAAAPIGVDAAPNSAYTTPLTPDSFFTSSKSPYASHMDEAIAQLEQENALLRQKLDWENGQLEEHSSILQLEIATHDTGFAPHTNPVTGSTMWTSANGRSCYFTEGTGSGTLATKRSTGISPLHSID